MLVYDSILKKSPYPQVDITALSLRNQAEATRKLAGVLFVLPRETLHMLTPEVLELCIDQDASDFICGVLERCDELEIADEEEAAEIVAEIAAEKKVIVARWIPPDLTVEIAKEAIAEMQRAATAVSEIEVIREEVRINGGRPQVVDGETPRPRFVIRNVAYALQPQEPINFVVERLFSTGSVSLVVGPPGSKKTYVMLNVAVCVALGKKWLDFETKQTKVLIIDEESGDRRMARRLGEVLRGEFADENTPIEYISLAQFNLRDPTETVLLQAVIEETGAGLVIIDALADIMPGADENAVKDVHPVFMRLRKIAEETEAAIIVIHHSNKAGDYRGSTAMSGAVDLLLMVDSKNGSPNVDFETKKARDVEPFRFAAVAHFNDGQVWLKSSEPLGNPKRMGKAQEYVLRFLVTNGPSIVSDIMDHADTCSDSAARKALYNLAGLGMVARIDQGGPGEKATYDLTELGRNYAESR